MGDPDRPDWEETVITSSRFLRETKVSVTSVNTDASLLAYSKAIKIYNDGPAVVYREINDTATTDSKPIHSRIAEGLDVDATSVGLVCATGKTATVWVTEFG